MDCIVIKNDGIGDLILSSGILTKLSEHFDGKLDLVTCIQNEEIAEKITGIREIYYVSRDDLRLTEYNNNRLANETDVLSLIKIVDKQYDVAICLRRFIRESSLIIMNWINARDKYCCWQIPTNTNVNDAEEFSRGWSHYNGDKYTLSELKYYWGFYSYITGNSINALPALSLDFDVNKEIYKDEKTIGLGISEGSVNLPEEFWLSVSKELVKKGWKIHLFGGNNQIELARKISELSSEVVDHVGKISFSETAKILENVFYYIGNDTGLSHFASLIVPKILVIIGGGTYLRFFPWPDKDDQYVIYHALDCYDCNWQCKYTSKRCLELVTPELLLLYFFKIANGHKLPRLINLCDEDTTYELLWTIFDESQGVIKFPSNL